MQKSNELQYPVSNLIERRRSSRSFSNRPVDEAQIHSLFEATRWAASSTNEQPWVYIYATRDQNDLWNQMLACLNEGNKIWAREAPLLILSLARKNFTRFKSENSYALYDLGGANALLSLQAVDLGLQTRQMAGFNHDLAIKEFNIPEAYHLGVFIAVGYPGTSTELPEVIQKKEMIARERVIQEEFVMNHAF
jgi:nitroreductase